MTLREALPGSKWFKYLVMRDSEDLHPYLPDTEQYSEENLWYFLEHYPTVFIKPEIGAGGRKVIRVVRDRKGGYHIRMEQRARQVRSLRDVHSLVERVGNGRRFIIQEGIDLAYWDGRPVDIRTILQVNALDNWEVTGIFCKLAGRDLAVTNVCIGGSAHPLEQYLKALGYGRKQRAWLVADLKEMSLAVIKPFADTYRNAIYGLDIGLDTSGNLFLIELNTTPRISIFREMRLNDMYKRARKLFQLNKTAARKDHLCRLPIVQPHEEPVAEVEVEDKEIEAETTPIEQERVEVPAGTTDTVEEKTNVEAASVEAASMEEASVEEASVEEASVEEASVEEASVEEASVEEASMEEASMEEASMEEASMEEASMEEASTEEVSTEEVSTEEVGMEQENHTKE